MGAQDATIKHTVEPLTAAAKGVSTFKGVAESNVPNLSAGDMSNEEAVCGWSPFVSAKI